MHLLHCLLQRQAHSLEYDNNDELLKQSGANQDRHVSSEQVELALGGECAEAGVGKADEQERQ